MSLNISLFLYAHSHLFYVCDIYNIYLCIYYLLYVYVYIYI